MSLSNQIRIAAFTAALLVVMTTLWHFCFIGFVDGSNFCLLLTIGIIATGFDVIRYLQEYYMAKPNRHITKTQAIVNSLMKLVVLFVMFETSATFSAKDVIIKHPPTILIELVTVCIWYIAYCQIQKVFEEHKKQ